MLRNVYYSDTVFISRMAKRNWLDGWVVVIAVSNERVNFPGYSIKFPTTPLKLVRGGAPSNESNDSYSKTNL